MKTQLRVPRSRVLVALVALAVTVTLANAGQVAAGAPPASAAADGVRDLVVGEWSWDEGDAITISGSDSGFTARVTKPLDTYGECFNSGDVIYKDGARDSWLTYRASRHECSKNNPNASWYAGHPLSISATGNTLELYSGGWSAPMTRQHPGFDCGDAGTYTAQQIIKAVKAAMDSGLYDGAAMTSIEAEPCRWLGSRAVLEGGGNGTVTEEADEGQDKDDKTPPVKCGTWDNSSDPAELYISDWPGKALAGTVTFSQERFCTDGKRVFSNCPEKDKKLCVAPPPDPVAIIKLDPKTINGLVMKASCVKASASPDGGRYIFVFTCTTSWSPGGLFALEGFQKTQKYTIINHPAHSNGTPLPPTVVVTGPVE